MARFIIYQPSSLLFLFAFPLLALLLWRLFNRILRRAKEDAEEESEEEAEEETRTSDKARFVNQQSTASCKSLLSGS